MCRLFGLTTGGPRVSAQFWLIDAPDSLLVQSRRNPDGSGIGYFAASGHPVLDKKPEPAYSDPDFLRDATTAESASFIAHVRIATVGARSMQNTHPFAMAGRIMAHNGGFGEITKLDDQLGDYARMVRGDTDSERYLALITQQVDAHGGDVAAGITAAARWIATQLPVVSLNAVIAAPDQLWALRYPDQHALHIFERPAGPSEPAATAGPASHAGPAAATRAGLHVRSSTSSVHSPALHMVRSVVVASERLDGETGWRMLGSGELVHVRPDLTVESVLAVPDPPARLVPLSGPNPNIDS